MRTRRQSLFYSDRYAQCTARLWNMHTGRALSWFFFFFFENWPILPTLFRATLVAFHYDDVRMGAIASQITSLTIVYSIVYSYADQRKHQSSASLAFVREIHRGPVNFPHKWPVTRIMFPLDDVIMWTIIGLSRLHICYLIKQTYNTDDKTA